MQLHEFAQSNSAPPEGLRSSPPLGGVAERRSLSGGDVEAASAQPVALALEGDHRRVVDEPVHQGGGNLASPRISPRTVEAAVRVTIEPHAGLRTGGRSARRRGSTGQVVRHLSRGRRHLAGAPGDHGVVGQRRPVLARIIARTGWRVTEVTRLPFGATYVAPSLKVIAPEPGSLRVDDHCAPGVVAAPTLRDR